MLLFLDIALFFCVSLFSVDLEVLYLGHVKNLDTIQYNTIHFIVSSIT